MNNNTSSGEHGNVENEGPKIEENLSQKNPLHANKGVLYSGIALTVLLIAFLIVGFFVNPDLTEGQAGIIKLLYPLLAGFATIMLGGEAVFRLVTEKRGNRIAFSATAGIAVFTFIYLNPPEYLEAKGAVVEQPHKVLVIDSFVRRYDKTLPVTNAEQIVDIIQDIDPDLSTEHMLVGSNFRNHDDIIAKSPDLIIIHLSSFFASTNKQVDIAEFDVAMGELTNFFNYILDNSKDINILVYTRKTPPSGVWSQEVHDAVIAGVKKQEEFIAKNSSRMRLLELPWDAVFTRSDVIMATKTALRSEFEEL